MTKDRVSVVVRTELLSYCADLQAASFSVPGGSDCGPRARNRGSAAARRIHSSPPRGHGRQPGLNLTAVPWAAWDRASIGTSGRAGRGVPRPECGARGSDLQTSRQKHGIRCLCHSHKFPELSVNPFPESAVCKRCMKLSLFRRFVASTGHGLTGPVQILLTRKSRHSFPSALGSRARLLAASCLLAEGFGGLAQGADGLLQRAQRAGTVVSWAVKCCP